MILMYKDGETKGIKFGDSLKGSRHGTQRPIGFAFEPSDSEDVKKIYHVKAAKGWYYVDLMTTLTGSAKDRLPNPDIPKGFFDYEPSVESNT